MFSYSNSNLKYKYIFWWCIVQPIELQNNKEKLPSEIVPKSLVIKAIMNQQCFPEQSHQQYYDYHYYFIINKLFGGKTDVCKSFVFLFCCSSERFYMKHIP